MSIRGFSICRALALQHPGRCLAVHTANPSFNKPTYKRGPLHHLKYQIAKIIRAKIPLLSFGYVPSEVQPLSRSRDAEDTARQNEMSRKDPLGPTLHRLYSLRPQTLAFSLCDSPVGLLAALLDVIHTRDLPQSPLSSRSRSPFLSPVELEMHRSDDEQEEHAEIPLGATARPQDPLSLATGEGDGRSYTWSPTEVLNFTMLQWLPGPEAVRCFYSGLTCGAGGVGKVLTERSISSSYADPLSTPNGMPHPLAPDIVFR
jgi:hypothetical protein